MFQKDLIVLSVKTQLVGSRLTPGADAFHRQRSRVKRFSNGFADDPREHARRALDEIDALRDDAEGFDPAASTQTFRIGSPDFMLTSFLAGAVERLCREAPLARLVVQPLGPDFRTFQFVPQPLHPLDGLAVRVDVVAVGIVATGYENDRGAATERLQNHVFGYARRAHGADDAV